MDIDVLSNAVYANGVPYDDLARLRRESPIHYQEVPDERLLGPAWVLTTHAHVTEASTMHHTMGNRHGLNLRASYSDDEPRHLLNLDGPEHIRRRRMTNTHFSPRAVRRYTEHYHDLAGRLLDDAINDGNGKFDLVDDVAVPLPLLAICELMGAPPTNIERIVRWSNAIITNDDPELSETEDVRTQALGEMLEYIDAMFMARRREPGDDLASVLAAEVESGALEHAEALSYAMLLFVAGNETTRNNISHTVQQLATSPDQWGALVAAVKADAENHPLLDTAVEEAVRWASPVIYMRRTAYEDIEFHGVTFKAGDPVVLHYASANRDEAVFGPTADRFDIARDPNPHLGFGFGRHICLGAHLARLETKAFLVELARRAKSIELTRPADYARSSFVHTIKRLPVSVTV